MNMIDNNELEQEILRLKKDKKIAILAHYYVDGEVQKIADLVGDSYFLSKKAIETPEETILFCGVKFMGESAKLLNPHKKVVMADDFADCPMAHMIDEEKILEVRNDNPDVAVVCYVNSTAEIKSLSDVCVTSSNAINVIRKLPNKTIFFIPDNQLGQFVASKIPEKKFIFHDGFCHVHTSIHLGELLVAKEKYPNAVVLTHPECKLDVIEQSDFVGSTSQILDYAKESKAKEFIICTEMGIFYELSLENPEKRFFSVGHRQFCPNMKRVTLEKVRNKLLNMEPQIQLDAQIMEAAVKPLTRMLELA